MNRCYLIFLVLLTACGPAEPADPLPEPDYDQFVSSVQPVLIDGCANPSGCHGSADRPFSLYAPGAHRKDSADTFSNTALTDAEIRHNYDRTRSFGADDGGGRPLLTKPLAEDAGGIAHGDGGDIYRSDDDRHFRILQQWLEDGDGGNR